MTPANVGIISGILKTITKIIIGLIKYFSLAILYAIGGVLLYVILDFNPFSGDLYSILYLVGFGISVILSLLIAFRGKIKKKDDDTPRWKREDRPKNWSEKRKEKKALKAERARESAEELLKQEREEEIRAQERRLEELRAERIKEEIAREERLLEEYRKEAAKAAYSRYEEVVSPHPVPTLNKESGRFGEPEKGVREPKDEPKIYMSAVEPNILIHEYKDRYEVYELAHGEKTLARIEYKDNR